jgi:hypothetical protein
VGILGGGLSGLSLGYYLSRMSRERNIDLCITLLEGSNRVGGWVNSHVHDGKCCKIISVCMHASHDLPCEYGDLQIMHIMNHVIYICIYMPCLFFLSPLISSLILPLTRLTPCEGFVFERGPRGIRGGPAAVEAMRLVRGMQTM